MSYHFRIMPRNGRIGVQLGCPEPRFSAVLAHSLQLEGRMSLHQVVRTLPLALCLAMVTAGAQDRGSLKYKFNKGDVVKYDVKCDAAVSLKGSDPIYTSVNGDDPFKMS